MLPGELHDSEAVFESSVMWHAISPASRYPPDKAMRPTIIASYDAGPGTISKHSPPPACTTPKATPPPPSLAEGRNTDKLSHYAQAYPNGKALDILCVRCTATTTRDLQDWSALGSHPGPRSRSLLAWSAGYCPSRGHTGAQYGNPFTLGAAPRFRMQDEIVTFEKETNSAAVELYD